MTSLHHSKRPTSAAASLDLLTVTSTELQELLSNGSITSLDLVDVYLDQIERENHDGLKLNAMISITPYDVLRQTARDLDREREQGVIRSSLHGIPITVKARQSPRLKVLAILLIVSLGQHHDRPRASAANDCWHVCLARQHCQTKCASS